MMQSHFYSLASNPPTIVGKGGFRIDAKKKQCPFLDGMSLSLLKLDPKGFREPHWHPNADELSYCFEGTGLMTIFSPNGGHETVTVQPGEIVFVPKGYLHDVENTGETPLRMLICFDHENAEDLNLSAAVSVMPNSIMGKTFSIDPKFFEALKKNIKGTYISQKENSTIPPLPYMTGLHKYNLGASRAQIDNKGGFVKMSNQFLLPLLKNLCIYQLRLNVQGAREPHWHPNAAELNYLIRGSAKIILLSPEGIYETIELKAGDLSFMPKGYLHHIENTGTEPAEFAVFFNNENPSDIGMSGCLGAYSNDLLSALFEVPKNYFDPLNKYQHDLLIIGGG